MNKLYEEPIYFLEDVVKEYVGKRKNLKEKEMKDLYRCIIQYIRELKGEYAIKIPRMGTLYRQIYTEFDNQHTSLLDEMFLDRLTNSGTKLDRKSFLQRQFKGMSLEEIQRYQNETVENS